MLSNTVSYNYEPDNTLDKLAREIFIEQLIAQAIKKVMKLKGIKSSDSHNPPPVSASIPEESLTAIKAILKQTFLQGKPNLTEDDLSKLSIADEKLAKDVYSKINQLWAKYNERIIKSITEQDIIKNLPWITWEQKRLEAGGVDGDQSSLDQAAGLQQEDLVGEDTNIDLHPDWVERIPELLQFTVLRLQHAIKTLSEVESQGSTGTLVFIHAGKAYIAWLGVSSTLLLKTKSNSREEEKENEIEAQLLTYPHQLTGVNLNRSDEGTPQEQELGRVKKEGGKIVRKGEDKGKLRFEQGQSLSHSLKPLRSFGNFAVPGMGRIASITVIDLPTNDANALLVLASNNSLKPSKMAELWQQYKPDVDKFNQQIASLAGQQNGNNSLKFIAINTRTSFFSYMVRGLGGDKVAKYLNENLIKIFKEEAANKPYLSESIQERINIKIAGRQRQQANAISDEIKKLTACLGKKQNEIDFASLKKSVRQITDSLELITLFDLSLIDKLIIYLSKCGLNFDSEPQLNSDLLNLMQEFSIFSTTTKLSILKQTIGHHTSENLLFNISLEIGGLSALKHYPGLSVCKKEEILAKGKQILKCIIQGSDKEQISQLAKDFSFAGYGFLQIFSSCFLNQIIELNTYASDEVIDANRSSAKKAQQKNDDKLVIGFNPKIIASIKPWHDKKIVKRSVALTGNFDRNSSAYIIQGQGGRETQQDAAEIIPNLILHTDWQESIPELLQSFIMQLQLKIMKRGQQNRELMSGSTATFVVIYKKKIYVAWLGDSPAFLIERNSDKSVEITQLTYDHNLNENGPFKGNEVARIESEGGKIGGDDDNKILSHKERKLAVSRAVGDLEFPGLGRVAQVNVVALPASANNKKMWVVVGSDGLTQALKPKQIAKVFSQDEPLENLGEECVHNAEKATLYTTADEGEIDNVTVVVIPVEESSQDKCTAVAVFDGHGDTPQAEALVQSLCDNFKETFPKLAASAKPQLQTINSFITNFRNQLKDLLASGMEDGECYQLVNELLKNQNLEVSDFFNKLIQLQEKTQNLFSTNYLLSKNLIELCEVINSNLNKLNNFHEFVSAEQEEVKRVAETYEDLLDITNKIDTISLIDKAIKCITVANILKICSSDRAQNGYKENLDSFIQCSNKIWAQEKRENRMLVFELQSKFLEEYFSNYEFLKRKGVFNGSEFFENTQEFKAIIAKRQALALIARKQNSWWQTPKNAALLVKLERDIKDNYNPDKLKESLDELIDNYEKRSGFMPWNFYNSLREMLRGKEIKTVTAEEAENIRNYLSPPAPAA